MDETVMGIFGVILRKYQLHRNPAAYWRKMGAHIGNNVEIYPSVTFGSEPYLITIGNNVRINQGVQLITHDGGVWVLRHLVEDYADADLVGPITIGDNVHIGTNAMIMPGITIGSNCIIGCGAIVTKDVPDNSVAVGIPARVIESVEDYLDKNKDKLEHTKTMSAKEKRSYLCDKYGINR